MDRTFKAEGCKQNLAWLDELQFIGIKLGLDRVRLLRRTLGNPGENLRFIHVAGTNGKGSTCAFAESVARSGGLSTGLYTSPHLLDPSERIKVNNIPVSYEEMAEGLTEIRKAARGFDPPPTYFEVFTLLALIIFDRTKPDVIFWETGMGGRLDATNIVSPAATLITPIGLDHQKYLGPTLGAIASEKAGIFKPGVPALTAPQKDEAAAVLQAVAARLDVSLEECQPTELPENVVLGLAGSHQRTNAALALGALRLTGLLPPLAKVRSGLASVTWPARFQRLLNWVVDGAHNPDGALALARAWQERFGNQKTTCIFSALDDKDARGMVLGLSSVVEQIVLCPISVRGRAPDLDVLKKTVKEVLPELPVAIAPNLQIAMEVSRQHNKPYPGIVTGSLYLCAEALLLLNQSGKSL